MSDTPEPLAAVLAEMRASALDSFAAKLVAEYEKTGRLDDGSAAQALKDDDAYIAALADRIEAAAERERDEDRQLAAIAESDEAFARCARCDRPERATGNAAAMRDALVKIERLNHYDLACIRSEKSRRAFDAKILDIELTIRAAIATPARNCDQFTTAEEARAAFEAEHSRGVVRNLYTATFDWLFAPARAEDAR